MWNSAQKIEAVDPIAVADTREFSSPYPVLSIEKIVAGGYGLGRLGSEVVLVPGGLPGEKLSVRIGDKRRGVRHADIQQIIQASANRISPSCAIAGQCGGCQFQHQTYESELIEKRAMVQDTLWRIGKLSFSGIPAVVPSPHAFQYRTTVRFVVFKEGPGFRLGFYRQGTRIPIQSTHCLLIPEPAKDLVTSVAQCLSDLRTLPVFLESLEVRWSEEKGKALLIFRGRYRHEQQARALLEMFEHLPNVVGFVVEPGQSDGLSDSKLPFVATGQDHLIQRFHELVLRIGFRSFMQVNWPVYQALGHKLLEWGDDLKGQRILEIYAGVGALGLTFARIGALVTIIEANPWAISDARRSATLSHVGRCRFRTEKAEMFLLGTNVGDYDLGIVDPPRTGLSPMTIQELGRILIPRLLYVSCDPATLARDLSRLSSYGYRILRIQPFDMFPQTAHIETLVELAL